MRNQAQNSQVLTIHNIAASGLYYKHKWRL
jgi:hypothetical protein